MPTLGLETEVIDAQVFENTVRRFREAGIRLPTFAELADPARIPAAATARLKGVGPDDANAANLFRVHWWNAADRTSRAALPEHVVLPKALTGVDAPIVVLLGNRFPMIAAHKVLAAYGCLVPRILTGQFDPTHHKAVWPSTGNYCRGGVAISRIMGCRGVAVLPEGMSRERFEWLERWVADASDVIRTPGTESNVKEIYDECARLMADPDNIVFNQFSEFGNYLAHFLCTGSAVEAVFDSLRTGLPDLRLAAYVSATGSGGTLAAGDRLKENHGTRIVAVEALECPTLLYNGFGEHNIQGIGDKHVPYIHNVMNTDVVTAISDKATDALNVLFNTKAGRDHLGQDLKVDPALIERLDAFGLSSICNVLAAIKTARHLRFGPNDVVATVATDGAAMYATEADKTLAQRFGGTFGRAEAAATHARYMAGLDGDHFLETTERDRERIFNLGYFTWVEQQGVAIRDFTARRDPKFWTGLRDLVPAWDRMIGEFNERTGLGG